MIKKYFTEILSATVFFHYVNSFSGRINLVSPLPLEEKIYKLEVTATDGEGLTSIIPAHVYISITGQNSHPPVFDHLTYSFSVPEDTVHGTTVGTIHATVQPVNGVTPGKIKFLFVPSRLWIWYICLCVQLYLQTELSIKNIDYLQQIMNMVSANSITE